MKYKAIGFDWGGVLNGRPGRYFGESVSDLLGVTHEQYLESYFSHNKKVNRGEITRNELWELVLNQLGRPDKLNKVMTLSQQASADSLNQDVLDLVDKLREAKYKVGLLSNNTSQKAEDMKRLGLDKHFDVFHVSALTGLVKPEPEAFTHLAQALDVNINELIFIDDSQKSLSTAKECGYTPILYDNYPALLKELERLGIEF